jgi:hypothetical protein
MVDRSGRLAGGGAERLTWKTVVVSIERVDATLLEVESRFLAGGHFAAIGSRSALERPGLSPRFSGWMTPDPGWLALVFGQHPEAFLRRPRAVFEFDDLCRV